MSMPEVKDQIAKMSVTERMEIAALIAHLNQFDDLDYQEELARRMSAMNEGQKNSADKLARRHQDLIKQGQ